ncbi:Alpha/Beta hydrolase protein, partial [Paraphysoderma sedebokerense]
DNEQLILPDPEDKETILSLAGMTANAYTEPTRSDWIDLNPDYHTNTSFGWNDSGIRGYVFASENDDLLVVAIKGTSAAFMGIGGGPTGGNDKINDNRMFSCCCARVDRTWRPVCDCYTGVGGVCNMTCIKQNADFEGSYYRAGKDIFGAVSQLYPHATIWFTGHSLGGALSALLGLTFNLPAVSFEAPGELMYAQRLGLPIPPDMSVLPIYHFGHNADPVFLGSCRGPRSSCYFAGYAIETKCHLGHKCQYNVRESANPTVDIRHHRIHEVINYVIKPWPGVAKCKPVQKNCRDCVGWEF